MKSEPGAYSWNDLVHDGETYWDGVRNYQARNHMKAMKLGDFVLFYHSVKDKCCVGIAKISKEFYQDPTIEDERWVAVDIVPVNEFNRVVTLDEIKKDDRLSNMVLIRNSRLSVQPVTEVEFDIIVNKGKN